MVRICAMWVSIVTEKDFMSVALVTDHCTGRYILTYEPSLSQTYIAVCNNNVT